MPAARKLKKTALPVPMPAVTALSPSELGDAARKAAEEILVAGQSENTLSSYRSAMRYWCAWAQLRYGAPLSLPVPVPTVVQFLVDHIARGTMEAPICELPKAIDDLMVESGLKGRRGPLKMNTVVHRLAVLSKLHQLRKKTNPCEDSAVRHLLSTAKRAAVKRGETVTKKTAATKEPLEAMLATCDDSLEGVRDRALLLFGWASGGRRRSEVAAATVENLRRIEGGEFAFRLQRSKTNQAGATTPEKPIRGKAAQALQAWLTRAEITTGPIFRRLWKGQVGPSALSGYSVAEIVKKRARMAGVEGDWGGHSLRSGFVTEAGRQRIPVGDVMALTDHRNVGTVVGYHRAGELFESEVAKLID